MNTRADLFVLNYSCHSLCLDELISITYTFLLLGFQRELRIVVEGWGGGSGGLGRWQYRRTPPCMKTRSQRLSKTTEISENYVIEY